ncbi:hypothetical protein ACJJTC_018023 [Scirpophaga incertulas]
MSQYSNPTANCASCQKMSMYVDVDKLIESVKHNPMLWDRTEETYSNKMLREKVWRKICLQQNAAYDKMDETEKYAYVKLVTKKWNQLRDSWIRDAKRRKERAQNGSLLSLPKRYKYYKELLFLKKVISNNSDTNDTSVKLEGREEDDGDDEITANEEYVSEESNDETITNDDFEVKRNPAKELRVRESTDPLTFTNDFQHEEIVPTYNAHTEPHLHFFKGLLPITATLNVDETLEFQSGVLSLLQRIKKQRRTDHFQSSEMSTLE